MILRQDPAGFGKTVAIDIASCPCPSLSAQVPPGVGDDGVIDGLTVGDTDGVNRDRTEGLFDSDGSYVGDIEVD